MSDFREEEALGKAYDSQLLGRLMTYLRDPGAQPDWGP